MKKQKQLFLFLLLACLLAACGDKNKPAYEHLDDALTDVKAFASGPDSSYQHFEFDASGDRVIKGADGTTIVLPKGCFNVEKGNVVFTLKEALSIDDMILSGLTTTSDGKLLKTGGMLYLSASQDGKPLSINPQKPVYIEVPARSKEAGMMAYKGVKQPDGTINWVSPKPLARYLVTVNMNELDFLPEGFAAEVHKAMPYRNHKTATKELIDSLYYSLSLASPATVPAGDTSALELNEPGLQGNWRKVKDGKYLKEAYEKQRFAGDSATGTEGLKREIDPAMIKAIRSDKFKNTFIATREFEQRLRTIFKTCNNKALEVYINNLDKDLWQCDSMAAAADNGAMHQKFLDFAAEKLTNVKNPPKSADILRRYYNRQLEKIRKKLQKLNDELEAGLKKADAKAEKLKESYREVLWERESYRMEKYGYEWSDTGWVNVDKPGPVIQELPKRIDVVVSNGAEMERTLCYVTLNNLKSLVRLNAQAKDHFLAGYNSTETGLWAMRGEDAHVVVIGYKGEQMFFSESPFTVSDDNNIHHTLKAVSKNEMKAIMARVKELSGEGKENSIAVDLEYQALLYKEKKRQEQLMKEEEFRRKLEAVAFPCGSCNENSIGAVLFRNNCTSCHAVNSVITGPALAGIGYRRNMEWLHGFIRNSQQMIKEGDEEAVRIYKEYNGAVMNSFPDLSGNEIRAIIQYLDCRESADNTMEMQQ